MNCFPLDQKNDIKPSTQKIHKLNKKEGVSEIGDIGLIQSQKEESVGKNVQNPRLFNESSTNKKYTK